MATLTWVGDVDRQWFTQRGSNTNWDGDRLPADGDTLVFGTASVGASTNDGPAGNSYSLDFRAGGHTVTGAAIRLDNPGVDVASSVGTVVLDLPLIVDGSQLQIAGGAVQATRTWTGTNGVEKTGAGTLRLDAANSHSGGFTLSGGTVDVRQDGALGVGMFTIVGGTLIAGGGARSLPNAVRFQGDLTVGGSSNVTLNAGRVGGIDLGSAARTVTVATATPSLFFDGEVSSGALTKRGPGRLALSRANSFSGGLTVTAGTVSFGDNGAAGTGTLRVEGGTLQADTASRTLANRVEVRGDFTVTGSRGLTFQGPLDLGAGAPTVRVDATTPHAWRGVANGAGFTKTGGGTLIVAGVGNEFADAVTLAQGALALESEQALGRATLHFGNASTGLSPLTLVLTAGVGLANSLVTGAAPLAPLTVQVSGGSATPTRWQGAVELRQELQVQTSAGGVLRWEGPIQNAGGERGRLRIQGGGRVELASAASDWRGALIAVGVGTVVATGESAGPGVLHGRVSIEVQSGATWRSLAAADAVAGLAGAGAAVINGRLEVGGAEGGIAGVGGDAPEFSGRLSGGGELVWHGATDDAAWRWAGAVVEVGAFTLARGRLELDAATRLVVAGDLQLGIDDGNATGPSRATLRLELPASPIADDVGLEVQGRVRRVGDARLQLVAPADASTLAAGEAGTAYRLLNRSSEDQDAWRLLDVDGVLLGEGAPLQVADQTYYLTYAGGDGNDLELLRRPHLRGGPERDQFFAEWDESGSVEVRLNADAPVRFEPSATTPTIRLEGNGDSATLVASLSQLSGLSDADFQRLQNYLRNPRAQTFVWPGAGASTRVEWSGFATVTLAVRDVGDITAPFLKLRARRQLLIGTAGDDVLTGTNDADLILGGVGDDWLAGGGGSDWIFGGAGRDQLFGELGHDSLLGGPGDDVLWGGMGNDTLDGGAGVDQVSGDGGVDRLQIRGNEAVDDVLLGGPEFDDLEFLAGTGEAALPRFSVAATSIERVLGNGQGWVGSDDDDDINLAGLTFTTLSPLAYVDGRAGDDTLIGSAFADWLIGGVGNDLLVGGGGADRLDGGVGDDELRGDLGDDVLDGGPGDDGLYGDGGNDRFLVRGDELVRDRVFGGGNTDRIVNVGDGDVELSNFRGASQAIEYWEGGGYGIVGTAGDDFFDFRNHPAATDAYAASTVVFVAVTWVDGRAGNDVIYGTNGDDRLRGGPADDRLFGLHGDDLLEGELGDDFLQGGAGSDTLRGDEGADELFGGAGIDRFIFVGDLSSGDVLGDYANDVLDLSGYPSGDPSRRWTTVFAVVGSSLASGAAASGELSVIGESTTEGDVARKRIRLNGVTAKPAASRVVL